MVNHRELSFLFISTLIYALKFHYMLQQLCGATNIQITDDGVFVQLQNVIKI